MTKREFEWYRNLFVLLGAVMIGLGLSMPFRADPKSFWQVLLLIVNTIGLIIVGLMQFGLARVRHRRAQKTK